MRNAIRAMTVCALLAGCPVAARAQMADRHVEVGGGLGVVGSWWAGPYSGGDLRIGVRASDRGVVETLVGLSPSGAGDNAMIGFYGVQFRHDFGGRGAAVRPFLTYGGIGVFGREHGYDVHYVSANGVATDRHVGGDTFVTPPFIGLVGGGIQRRVSSRLAVRVEVQALVALIIPAGVRVAAGVTVPVGRVTQMASTIASR